MSPLNKQMIESKLFKLQEVTNVLEELKHESKAAFLKDARINGAAMFNMAIGIELIVDVGMHILTETFQRPAKEYQEVISLLGETKVIPEDLLRGSKKMAGFRNRLIHDYDKIDLNKVYANLQKAPVIYRDYAKYFILFIEKHR